MPKESGSLPLVVNIGISIGQPQHPPGRDATRRELNALFAAMKARYGKRACPLCSRADLWAFYPRLFRNPLCSRFKKFVFQMQRNRIWKCFLIHEMSADAETNSAARHTFQGVAV